MKACKTWMAALIGACCATAYAGDRLLASGGVSTIEGAGGSGLVPWATITGNGSANQIGGVAFATRVQMPSQYRLDVAGWRWACMTGLSSVPRWTFGLADTVPDKSIEMKVFGAKIKVLGDAVYDQDRWMP